MSKLIGLGKCSKYYLYILYEVLIHAIRDIIYGFKYIDHRNKEDFIIIKPIPLFNRHVLLQNLFRYLGFIIGGFIFQIIKRKSSKRNKEKNNSGIKLIYAKKKFTKRQIFDIIIIGLFFCIAFEGKKLLYIMNFFFIDFWPFNIVFIIIFMNIYFKIEFYNFQKLSLLFVVISNLILLLINTFLRQPRDPEKRNEYEIYRDTMGNAALCVPFIFLFILMHCCVSYARVKTKVLSTLQFISNFVIIIVIGACGIVLTIIEILFSENIK